MVTGVQGGPTTTAGAEYPGIGLPPPYGERSATWGELFYDLVFVVAVANLARRLLHEMSLQALLEFSVLFGVLWWAWASYTFLVDRFNSDDAFQRVLSVLQMFGIAGMAASFEVGDHSFATVSLPFAIAYAVTRALLLLMYARVWWRLESSRPLVSGYLAGFGVETVMWAASVLVPPPWRYVVWAAAMVISLATPWVVRRAQARLPLNPSHLPERFGLFTILVLGELVAVTVAGIDAANWSAAVALAAPAGLVVATGMWWIYFDNLEGSIVRRDLTREHDWRPTAWIYAHMPLALCIVLTGAGMEPLIHAAAHHEHVALAARSLPALGLAGGFLAMALILASGAAVGDVAKRRRRAWIRGAGALSAVVLALAARAMAPELVLVALGVLVLVQVIADSLDVMVRHRLAPAAG